MKSGKLILAIASLVALAIPVSLAAQEHFPKSHQYNLIDMGTLGGPASYYSGQGEGAQVLMTGESSPVTPTLPPPIPSLQIVSTQTASSLTPFYGTTEWRLTWEQSPTAALSPRSMTAGGFPGIHKTGSWIH
jgi:hypothetical protein